MSPEMGRRKTYSYGFVWGRVVMITSNMIKLLNVKILFIDCYSTERKARLRLLLTKLQNFIDSILLYKSNLVWINRASLLIFVRQAKCLSIKKGNMSWVHPSDFPTKKIAKTLIFLAFEHCSKKSATSLMIRKIPLIQKKKNCGYLSNNIICVYNFFRNKRKLMWKRIRLKLSPRSINDAWNYYFR